MLSLKNVKVPVSENIDYKKIIAKYLGVSSNKIISYKIYKESVDARVGHEFCYVYEFLVEVSDEDKYLKNKHVTKYIEEVYEFPKCGNTPLVSRPVIVGAGPAGLFCAYMLAKHGYKPILFERGKSVEERIKDVDTFWRDGILNKNSNVQFGEGGAGTFSDGKLNTLTHDRMHRAREVFNIFVSCGAHEDILYSNHPHIGSDVLRDVIKELRNKIISWGGEIHFNSLVSDLIINNGEVKGVIVNGEKIASEVVVLAIGHSARDTFNMLYNNNLNIISKPFAVGVRIVHPQELIDKNQYPLVYPNLPPASYKLTYTNSDGRGVYSFCMCPGGYVVSSASGDTSVVTNGMSNYMRDSEFANSAIIVTVDSKDYGDGVFDGLKFMESLENNAYKLAGGALPIQKFRDYEIGKISKDIENTDAFTKGRVKECNINDIFPDYINKALKNGINYFDNKIHGFKDGVILAPETRTSSPVRIVRDENLESNILGIYPCGEGSGYAGGITTSAVDGIKVAEEIAKKYKNVI